MYVLLEREREIAVSTVLMGPDMGATDGPPWAGTGWQVFLPGNHPSLGLINRSKPDSSNMIGRQCGIAPGLCKGGDTGGRVMISIGFKLPHGTGTCVVF